MILYRALWCYVMLLKIAMYNAQCSFFHWIIFIHWDMNKEKITSRTAVKLMNINKIKIFTADRQRMIYWAINHLLAKIYFDCNTHETMKKQLYPSDSSKFPPMHWITLQIFVTVTQTFTGISYVYMRKNDVASSNVKKTWMMGRMTS